MHRFPYGASGSVVDKPPRQGLAIASSSAGVSGYSQQKRTKTKVLGDKVSQEEEKEKYGTPHSSSGEGSLRNDDYG